MQLKYLYYLQTTLHDGRDAWYIIKCFDSIKLELIKKRIADNSPYNIRDYADILYAGYEAEAPQEILDAVNSEFGTEFSN